ncbi:hypothetical protein [Halorubrum sp. CSM-61]|uniref:hypothetical protein n=1 Tax=Halorubrum sp. CSM-61 TaxID=2485838 RepID=UPI001F155DCA|nr:hypothetical protein [Halorubrum sp. CSM-61]
MDVKIGKSTDIDNTLRQYSRLNRDIELLDMWTPNPDKNLSTTERGVHAVAEKYAYDKQSEKFVFLQDAYQEFAETVNMLLRDVSREDLAAASASSESDAVGDGCDSVGDHVVGNAVAVVERADDLQRTVGDPSVELPVQFVGRLDLDAERGVRVDADDDARAVRSGASLDAL